MQSYYQFDDNGHYRFEGRAKRDPKDPTKYLLPGKCTWLRPPDNNDPAKIQKFDPITKTWSLDIDPITAKQDAAIKAAADEAKKIADQALLEERDSLGVQTYEPVGNTVKPRSTVDIQADRLDTIRIYMQAKVDQALLKFSYLSGLAFLYNVPAAEIQSLKDYHAALAAIMPSIVDDTFDWKNFTMPTAPTITIP